MDNQDVESIMSLPLDQELSDLIYESDSDSDSNSDSNLDSYSDSNTDSNTAFEPNDRTHETI